MAHLWVQSGEAVHWAIIELATNAISLSNTSPKPLPAWSTAKESDLGVVLLCGRCRGQDAWIIVAQPGNEVRINGTRVASGMRVLADRDEIRVAGKKSLFFSTERLANVEAFPGIESTAYCPRCKQAIQLGRPSVKCPGCGVFYHQDEELPCWRYSETCALCPQATNMDAGFRWTPEEL
jgi:hypothetical protein